MDNVGCTAVFKPLRLNLVLLPSSVASLLFAANIPVQDVVVEVAWTLRGKHSIFTGWSGMVATGLTLEMDAAAGQAWGVADGTATTVSIRFNTPAASSVVLEPVTAADWEVVELHAQFLEDRLLNQTRCVAMSQTLVVYPTATTTALLVVVSMDVDGEFARLLPSAEVSIAPKKVHAVEEPVEVPEVSAPPVLLRGIALPHPAFPPATPGYQVFVNADVMQQIGATNYVSVQVVRGPRHSPPEELEQLEATRITASVVHHDTLFGSPHVGLLPCLATALNADGVIGAVVALSAAPAPFTSLPTVYIHPYTTTLPQDTRIHKKERAALATTIADALYASGINTLAWTNFAVLPRMDGLPHGGMLEFRKCGEGWIAPHARGALKIDLKPWAVKKESQVPRSCLDPEPVSCALVIGIDPILNSTTRLLRRPTGVLLHGPLGCGKTVASSAIAQRLNAAGVHTLTVQCEDHASELFNTLKAAMNDWAAECAWHAPSVLVLDNLETILPVPGEHQDNQSSQGAEHLAALVSSIQATRLVAVLATAPGREAVSKVVFLGHMLEETVKLGTPDKTLRGELLAAYATESDATWGMELGDVVAETEGYVASDLRIFVERCVGEVLAAGNLAPLTLAESAVTTTLAGYTPSNLRGVQLQKSTTSWADIGGLGPAKTVLLETLEWPTKYAPIFASCPLRLRLGILLYGYPGCGKTLLASAVAAQCGLNFISVKGPEILNKYIGALEQSVRDLFERAQLAKPCILFFDEFDLIAPKRGHDSTGVTDRVVNQMLTQMDGAEGLDGVYVLAATLRPDLIDSALLRPGRLDKSVICDMPSQSDRVDILECVTAKMELDPLVLLEAVAQQAAGCSGADLQALAYNAYLKAVHRRLAEDTPRVEKQHVEWFQSGTTTGARRAAVQAQVEALLELASSKTETEVKRPVVVITKQDFDESAADTKPSISRSEMAKLEGIYRQFVSGREGNMEDGDGGSEVGSRTTLM